MPVSQAGLQPFVETPHDDIASKCQGIDDGDVVVVVVVVACLLGRVLGRVVIA